MTNNTVIIDICNGSTPEYNGVTGIPVSEDKYILISEDDIETLSKYTVVNATYRSHDGTTGDVEVTQKEIQVVSDIGYLEDLDLGEAIYDALETGMV